LLFGSHLIRRRRNVLDHSLYPRDVRRRSALITSPADLDARCQPLWLISSGCVRWSSSGGWRLYGTARIGRGSCASQGDIALPRLVSFQW